ncbi:MAG: PD-(D/E)XK nuclease family protein [Bacteroidota bacterium]
MQTFLSKVTQQFLEENIDLSNHIFILPNIRAGIFLKTEFIKQQTKTAFLPHIISIEEFISNISNFSTLDNLSQIFDLYTAYLKLNSKNEIEPFESFSKWAFLLLQDFNEIDKNLINADEVFEYLIDAKRIDKLFLSENKESEITQNYFNFIEKIVLYYHAFNKILKDKKVGYQGLLYREAVNNLSNFIKNSKTQKYIFVGFNALNKAEELIINELLNNNIAEIYWDSDKYYLNKNTVAGRFLKTYKNNWKYYNNNDYNWVFDHLNDPKKIELVGTSKNIGQIKYIGEILNNLEDKNNNYQNTAIVLADEKLLPILLNSLPHQVNNVNITMGYNLKNIALASLFDLLLKLHLNNKKIQQKNKFFFNDFINFINLPFLNSIIDQALLNEKINFLVKNNTVIIDYNQIIEILDQTKINGININFLFDNWDKNIYEILNYIIEFIDILKSNKNLNYLEKEYLFRFNNIFQQLKYLNNEFGFINNLKSFYHFYLQILQNETLSFRGEPLQGLQIMGMLESRVLDFENIIITSVNEGFIPSGKKQNSFIPYDIKTHFKIPTYKEKDAIYSYHFYRLIQRAKKIFLLYNTQNDDFGSGEQSRFITQLEIAKETNALPNLNISKLIINPIVSTNFIELKQIVKTDTIIEKLKVLAIRGFSPSALTSYIRNPMDFYKKRILKIKDLDEVEESVAYNTFGTIIHNTLENLYKPYKGKILSQSDLKTIRSLVNKEVKSQFTNFFTKESTTSGRNYLSFEIAKKYINNLLNYESDLILKGRQIKILELEKEVSHKFFIDSLGFTITLKGIIDRVDEIDGILRIVDYKTGKVAKGDLNIKDWEIISTDYKYSKSFQVLMYAFLYAKSQNIDFNNTKINSGIISFKNLKIGFMGVNNNPIETNDMDSFTQQLNNLILDIFNKDIPFTEKEIKQFKY